MPKVTLDPVPASAQAARKFVADYLAARHLTTCVDAVLLVVSELTTNAIVHAQTVIDVWVDANGPNVRVGVDDLDDTLLPSPKVADPDATGGRGLALIEATASMWGTDYTRHGKRTWAEIVCT